jgi:3D (Asp-Asp-Asp) domain-containing protein
MSMLRYILAITIIISSYTTVAKNNLFDSHSYGPPTLTEYMLQKGHAAPDTFVVTAYLPIDELENRFHGITFSGVPAKPYHTLAVDPEVIPLGAWVYIEDLGWWKAEDTGNLIKGKRLDICVPSRDEAVIWGKQSRQVWILDTGDDEHELDPENMALTANFVDTQG